MSKRQQLREQRRRQSRMSNLLWISVVVILVAIVGYFVFSSANTPATPDATGTPLASSVPPADLLGQAVTVNPDRSHIEKDSDPGPYSTNPPTSGHHYPVWMDAGFYDTNKYTYPQGYLVHNLEHGYIIFWYNCKILTDAQCSDLKTQIKAVMSAASNFKVIAYPWDSIDIPLILTSWGYMLRMEKFDAALATKYIEQHRNRAPEPEAP